MLFSNLRCMPDRRVEDSTGYNIYECCEVAHRSIERQKILMLVVGFLHWLFSDGLVIIPSSRCNTNLKTNKSHWNNPNRSFLIAFEHFLNQRSTFINWYRWNELPSVKENGYWIEQEGLIQKIEDKRASSGWTMHLVYAGGDFSVESYLQTSLACPNVRYYKLGTN